jgi:protein gp37
MGDKTAISWTDKTFNPWWGCTKISEACEHCYAEAWEKRCGFDVFGPDDPRRLFGDAHWAEPVKWNRAAEKAGRHFTVFCGSMCDLFEKLEYAPDDLNLARLRLWNLIEDTPNLIWLLLTKRPGNISALTPFRWEMNWPENVWTGTTLELQKHESRLDPLIQVPGRHFVSIEPMLGPINLFEWLGPYGPPGSLQQPPQLDWVICGGESGANARPMNPDWVRSLRDQCLVADIPFHFKQWGEWSGPQDSYMVRDALDEKVVHWHGSVSSRVGVKKAGHMLDGQEWLEFPAFISKKTIDNTLARQ